jgi:ATP-binding cassette subfamily C protein
MSEHIKSSDGSVVKFDKIKQVLMKSKSSIIVIFMLSALINIFVLNGSIYMMMVYDRALPSQNLPTLFGLFGFSIFIYVAQGYFEVLRGRMLSDVAITLEHEISPMAIRSADELAIVGSTGDRDNSPLRDLEQVRSFIAGPGPAALMDLPWIIFFIAILSLLHIWLGVAALAGAVVLIVLTVISERMNKKSIGAIGELSQSRGRLIDRKRRSAETIQSLGMRSRFAKMFLDVNGQLLGKQSAVNDVAIVVTTTSKTMRMFIQSALLTVGALLVINGMVSAGVIFASSILAGRALAPIDQAIAQWRGFSSARVSWARLNETITRFGIPPERTLLPRPKGRVNVENLTVAPPGQEVPTLNDVSFACEGGSIIGVIGSSAAGKSTLARALVGVWPSLQGDVRLDGAALTQWDPDLLGEHVGYLAQGVELLDGTVAQNIARFDPNASSDAIMRAGELAGVHDLVLRLPKGYETQVGEDGRNLSAGQRQRIGLARALYNDPSFVVLDEPNSNLDAAGESALALALINLRRIGSTAVVITHRQSVLRFATHILYLADGKVVDFGPRDRVLQSIKERNNVEPIETQAEASA